MDDSDSWCRVDADGVVRLTVHIQPGASRTGIAGRHGNALKIRLSAPAVDGKANACLVEYVAGLLEVSRGSVELASGASSRRKLLKVSGVKAAALGALRQAVQTV